MLKTRLMVVRKQSRFQIIKTKKSGTGDPRGDSMNPVITAPSLDKQELLDRSLTGWIAGRMEYWIFGRKPISSEQGVTVWVT